MGHNISGVIAKREPLVAAAVEPWVVAPLGDGFAMAVREDVQGYPEDTLPEQMIELVERVKTTAPVAAVVTAYFGGSGSQAAGAWHGSRSVAYEQAGSAINTALAFIGATKGGAIDTFDALGLGWFRSNDDWIEFARHGKLEWQREPWPAAYAAWTEHNKSH